MSGRKIELLLIVICLQFWDFSHASCIMTGRWAGMPRAALSSKFFVAEGGIELLKPAKGQITQGKYRVINGRGAKIYWPINIETHDSYIRMKTQNKT